MTILVTGCAGFIGSKVASLLLNDDITVWGVDGLAESPTSALREWRLTRLLRHPCFSFQRVDITDMRSLKSLFLDAHRSDPVSAVFNMAALAGVRGSVEAPHQYYQVNVRGLSTLWNCAASLASTSLSLPQLPACTARLWTVRSARILQQTVHCLRMRLPRKPPKRCRIRITTFMEWTQSRYDTSRSMGRRAALI